MIAMTANAMAETGNGIRAGMDDYLSKPVKQKELDLVLDRWLSGSDKERCSLQASVGALQQAATDTGQIFDEREMFERLGGIRLLQEIVGMACDDLPVRD